MKTVLWLTFGGLATGFLACAPAPAPNALPSNARTVSDTAAAGAVSPGDTAEGLVPSGYGTLRQEQVTVSLRSDALLIKVTPLAEPVIRLTAPDTYRRLHGLAESRRERAESAALDPELMLVSFFSYEPDVPFQPDDVQLLYRGRVLRPMMILPITSGWGSQRLRQGETQNAIYVFNADIDYDVPALVVRYGLQRSNQWSRVVPRLQTERSRVLTQIES